MGLQGTQACPQHLPLQGNAPSLRTSPPSPASLLHVGVRQVLAVDDHVGMVGGLQGKAPIADAAAVTLLLVRVHDVLQVPLPPTEGELRAGTVFTPAHRPRPVPALPCTKAPRMPCAARHPAGRGPAPQGGATITTSRGLRG